MEADKRDPVIGVHVLTEFVFCPRAGLCAYEARGEDLGDEILAPSVDYLPRYDLHQMEDALQEVKRRIWGLALVGSVVAAATAVLTLFVHPEVIWLGMVGLAFVGWRLLPLFKKAMILAWRQWHCLNAQPKEPDPESTENQRVNWWELLHAGFRSIPYKDNLYDEHWRLAGRPWRVLRRGSQRIPVFRKRRGDAEIRRQHKVRMAAYCHLMVECEAAESPYGIVLFGETYEGVAVANAPGTRKIFHDELVAARLVVRRAEGEGAQPERPANASLCRGCPVGKPFVHRSGVTEYESGGETLDVFPAFGDDGRPYHSRCGDRFGWVPPHEKAVAKGVRPGE